MPSSRARTRPPLLPAQANPTPPRHPPPPADGNPWRHSAREMTALLAERQGDRAVAKTLLGGLVNDTSAPRGIRTRATEMLTRLDG